MFNVIFANRDTTFLESRLSGMELIVVYVKLALLVRTEKSSNPAKNLCTRTHLDNKHVKHAVKVASYPQCRLILVNLGLHVNFALTGNGPQQTHLSVFHALQIILVSMESKQIALKGLSIREHFSQAVYIVEVAMAIDI